MVRSRTERYPRAGIYIDESQLQGADIFRVHEFPAWVFCTDAVKAFVEEEGYSNVDFLNMGEAY